MSRRTPLVLVLFAALLSGGCGTLDNINRPGIAPPEKPDAKVCRAYGGVRSDWAIISDYPLTQTTMYLDYVCIPVLAAGDLFLDLVCDTLTLPYTVVEELRRALRRPDASANYVPLTVPAAVPAPPLAAIPASVPQTNR